MSNHRNQSNTVPVGSLAKMLVLALFVGAAALSYLYLKDRVHTTGDAIKGLERELADIKTQNEMLRSKISQFSSHAALQRRFNEGMIKLVPITSDRIVRIGGSSRPDSSGEIRAVANRESAQ